MTSSLDKLNYLKSLQGQSPTSIMLSVVFPGGAVSPDLLPALEAKVSAELQNVIAAQVKSLTQGAKSELRDKIAALRAEIADLQAQLDSL